MKAKIFAIGAAVLLLLLQGLTVQAQEESALEGVLGGVEEALGDIDLESLVPDAIGGILGGPIVTVINTIVTYLCVSPLLYGAIGCLFCGVGGPILCIFYFVFGLMQTMLTLCCLPINLLCGYCPCSWPTYAISSVIYSLCTKIAGEPLAERLMGAMGA